MPSDTPPLEETQARSVEGVREQLLTFLRLVAKNVVRRLAQTDSAVLPQSGERKIPRHKP